MVPKTRTFPVARLDRQLRFGCGLNHLRLGRFNGGLGRCDRRSFLRRDLLRR